MIVNKCKICHEEFKCDYEEVKCRSSFYTRLGECECNFCYIKRSLSNDYESIDYITNQVKKCDSSLTDEKIKIMILATKL